jgi:hypothetical protein
MTILRGSEEMASVVCTSRVLNRDIDLVGWFALIAFKFRSAAFPELGHLLISARTNSNSIHNGHAHGGGASFGYLLPKAQRASII